MTLLKYMQKCVHFMTAGSIILTTTQPKLKAYQWVKNYNLLKIVIFNIR